MGERFKTYEQGDIVKMAGIKFVVLDDVTPPDRPGVCRDLFIMTLEPQGDSWFGDTNNYTESELRRRIDKWVAELVECGVNSELIYTRTLDLTTLDGHGKYGKLEVEAAPLTMDEARKYADIIPAGADAYWLATGWGGPGYFGSARALGVNSDGSWNFNYCSGSYGIRPALVVSSFELETEEHVDLSDVSTAELLDEVARRRYVWRGEI